MRANISSLFLFRPPGTVARSRAPPYSHWPCSLHGERSSPVAAVHHRPMWDGPHYPCSRCHWGSCHWLRSSLPQFGPASSLLCSASATALPVVTHRHRATSELSDQTKRSASSPCPSCIKSLPTAPTSKAGQWDSPHHRLPPWAPHWWQASSIVPPPRRPRNKFHTAKELLPNHFSDCLGYSFGPSPVPPPVDTRATAEATVLWAPPSRPPLLGFLVAACRPMSNDHFPSICLGFPPSSSQWWARHHASAKS
jgi:hypothetical protein